MKEQFVVDVVDEVVEKGESNAENDIDLQVDGSLAKVETGQVVVDVVDELLEKGDSDAENDIDRQVDGSLAKVETGQLAVDDVDEVVKKGDSNAESDIESEVDRLPAKVEKREKRVTEIEPFNLNSTKLQASTSHKSSLVKDKDKVKHIPRYKNHQQEAARREAASAKRMEAIIFDPIFSEHRQEAAHREAAAAKRMQDIMRQFGSILHQFTQHKLAWPFMQPVDVAGLGLRDYYEVIDKPMDFSTIKNQMEAKDGTQYIHVMDICSDVRLIFQNAMKYNDDKSEVHGMAKALLEEFEEKWRQFLPRVAREEKRRKEEEAEEQLSWHRALEAAHAKMARVLSNELYETDMRSEEPRETVDQKCRMMDCRLHFKSMENGDALIIREENCGDHLFVLDSRMLLDAKCSPVLRFEKCTLSSKGKWSASTASGGIELFRFWESRYQQHKFISLQCSSAFKYDALTPPCGTPSPLKEGSLFPSSDAPPLMDYDFEIRGSWRNRNCALYAAGSEKKIAQMHPHENAVDFLVQVTGNITAQFVGCFFGAVFAMKGEAGRRDEEEEEAAAAAAAAAARIPEFGAYCCRAVCACVFFTSFVLFVIFLFVYCLSDRCF